MARLQPFFRGSSFIALLSIAVATPVAGAVAPQCAEAPTISPGHWSPPLDRSVTIRSQKLTLRDALKQIASAADVRLSYSREQIPLERVVCVAFEQAQLGDVLTAVLEGVAVDLRAVGPEQVVLTPRSTRAAIEELLPPQEPVFPLQPVIATAIAAEYPVHEPSYTVTVIDRADLAHQSTIGAAINASVPGAWVWQSPSGFTSQYSTRGASSFGASSPKIYIDGIEVANPLLMTQLEPENIERIEIIRGPQGAALYGTDAINGVTNIVTRHAALPDGAPRVRVRSGLALSTSSFMPAAGVGQEHELSAQLGSRAHTATLNLGLGSVGEFMPGAYSRHINFDGNGRLVGDRTMLTGTARFYSQSAGNPAGLITDSAFTGGRLGMQQYTLGARAVFRPSERITHSLVVGIDGYELSGVPKDSVSSLSLADSILRAAGDGGMRTTLRIATVAQLVDRKAVDTKATFSAEHSSLNQHGIAGPTVAFDQALNGVSAQFDAAFFDRAFLTAGVRVERDNINGVAAHSTLPMLGASYVIGDRAFNVRLRTAYGKAIRWPSTTTHPYDWSAPAAPTSLSPEQQSGIEAGVDIMFGKTAGFQITRYDQIASGLMQCVTIVEEVTYGHYSKTESYYAMQSVGEIANRGWEMQAFVRHGPLSLSGTLALTDSRVLQVADGYSGDLAAGDRMLAVPARTMGLQAQWREPQWSATVSAARAFDWINYDRLALNRQDAQIAGQALRAYWRDYNGATHVRAMFTHDVAQNLTLVLTGDNLLGRQTGEPDNLTVVPGRTVSFGVRAAF